MTRPGGTTAAGRFIRAGEDIPVDTPRVPAREAARDELSDPMYHEHDPNLVERGMDRFWDWIGGPLLQRRRGRPGRPARARPHRPGRHRPGRRPVVEARDAATHTPRARRPLRQHHTQCGRTTAPRRTPTPKPGAGPKQSRNACAPSSGPWRTGPSSTRAPAAPRTRQPPKPVGCCPRTPTRLRAAARVFDDVTYGGRTADETAYLSSVQPRPGLEAAEPLLTAGRAGGPPRDRHDGRCHHLGLPHPPTDLAARPRACCSPSSSSCSPESPSPRSAPGGQHGRLDPRSADPEASRAVAELLEDRGISVDVATTLDEATGSGGTRHHSARHRAQPAHRAPAAAPPYRNLRLRGPHRPHRHRPAPPWTGSRPPRVPRPHTGR